MKASYLILASILTLSLAACSKDEGSTTTLKTGAEDAAKVVGDTAEKAVEKTEEVATEAVELLQEKTTEATTAVTEAASQEEEAKEKVKK